jgi:hypothetical protein
LQVIPGSNARVTMASPVKSQTAAAILGGPRSLRDYLRQPSARVIAWMSGGEEPPDAVFLRALEVVLDDLDQQEPGARKDPASR